MLAQSAIQIIKHGGVEAKVYQVQQGYRVEVSGTETDFYWHPGIFTNRQELWQWLRPQLEALIDNGLALGGEWMTLEGDFDGNQLYRNWFICQKQEHWEDYDPLFQSLIRIKLIWNQKHHEQDSGSNKLINCYQKLKWKHINSAYKTGHKKVTSKPISLLPLHTKVKKYQGQIYPTSCT